MQGLQADRTHACLCCNPLPAHPPCIPAIANTDAALSSAHLLQHCRVLCSLGEEGRAEGAVLLQLQSGLQVEGRRGRGACWSVGHAPVWAVGPPAW